MNRPQRLAAISRQPRPPRRPPVLPDHRSGAEGIQRLGFHALAATPPTVTPPAREQRRPEIVSSSRECGVCVSKAR